EEAYLGLEGDEYPVLVLTPRYREAFDEEKTIMMMLPKEKTPEKRKDSGRLPLDRAEPVGKTKIPRTPEKTGTGKNGFQEDNIDEALFLKLKELRGRLSQEAGVPAYIVFSDASLRDMCRKRPQSPEQFLNVAGVGAVKLEKYGDAFLGIIRDFN
ncbi:MAG: HRDC domain-containing protein, partial [Treponema sp.]|nr:HRDC domain-containing protein [Treponema sp.]